MLAEAISDEDLAAIRLYLQQQRAYGRDDFRAMVEAKTQRFASVRSRPSAGQIQANHRIGISEPDPVLGRSDPAFRR